jgi:hypothetical protein
MSEMEAMQVITGMTEGDSVEALQALIDSGQAWHMEGFIGRLAQSCMENGDCVLGPEGVRDYYGNYIPSRTEVEPGSIGSLEYAEQRQEDR